MSSKRGQKITASSSCRFKRPQRHIPLKKARFELEVKKIENQNPLSPVEDEEVGVITNFFFSLLVFPWWVTEIKPSGGLWAIGDFFHFMYLEGNFLSQNLALLFFFFFS